MGTVIGIAACVTLMAIGYLAGYSDARRACRKRLMDRLYQPGRN